VTDTPGIPSHHRAGGGFANPWPDSAPSGSPLSVLKWQWQRLRYGVPKLPPASSLPVARPNVTHPAAPADDMRLTWLGQSSFLLQIAGLNLLTDPLLSRRASPFAHLGPERLVAAPLSVADLPRIDAVLLSHDHYDHLDTATCRSLLRRFGSGLPFFTPLGYERWFARLGATRVIERDWWQRASLDGTGLELHCLPAQHWTRRGFTINQRLWCSWLLHTPAGSIYFAGDSGYCSVFAEIRARIGAPDVALLPIGAYEPRWFMKPAHMNPDEAVQSYLDLGARDFVGMHWGTFRLTDEPMLEPPERTRAAWRMHGLPDDRLNIPAHGETLTWRQKIRSTT
jgi:N-acyl-phosphatidylethanolamine-hydrolysing phospholipase D